MQKWHTVASLLPETPLGTMSTEAPLIQEPELQQEARTMQVHHQICQV